MEKILEKSGKFVSPKMWEPCLNVNRVQLFPGFGFMNWYLYDIIFGLPGLGL